MRTIIVLVASVLLAGLTTTLSIVAYSLAHAAAPAPAIISIPPILATGELCTYPAARFETLNATCFPTAFNDTATFNYCRARRNATDVSCVIAACTTYMAQVYPRSTTNATYIRSMMVTRSRLELYTIGDVWDLGPVRIAQALRQFVIDNRPDALTPRILPIPRSMSTTNGAYPVDQTGLISFRSPAREFARQFMVFYWNYLSNQRPEMTPTNRDALVLNTVVTPSRCPNAGVASIPWLQGNNVTVRQLYSASSHLLVQSAAFFTSANWLASCSNAVADFPQFCALFSSYYSIDSLNDATTKPSPFVDLTNVLTAYNDEFADCGPARGCFGYTASP